MVDVLYLSTFVTAAEEDGGLALLLPEWPELVAGIIAFAILYFFVWKWVWPHLTKMLETRQTAISEELTAAEKAKVEAESLRADYQSQLAEARAEGGRIIEEARQSAEKLRVDIVAKAEADADQIRAKARDEAENEVSRALAEAKGQVGDISVELAAKILGESLDQSAHQALIDRYLADLERL